MATRKITFPCDTSIEAEGTYVTITEQLKGGASVSKSGTNVIITYDFGSDSLAQMLVYKGEKNNG